MMATWLDKAIGWVWPNWGMRRVESRAWLRSYDATDIDRLRSRGANKNVGPQTEARNSRAKLLDVARSLDRNNAFAHGIFNSLVDNVVGDGIRLDARCATSSGRPLRAKNDAIEAAWSEWEHGCDRSGLLSFTEIQRMVERELWVAGEVLVVNEAATDKRRIPLALDVIESERLAPIDSSSDVASGNTLVQGVEFNQSGAIVAYHIYRGHPTDSLEGAQTRRVAANRVLHLFHTRRPGEVRGLSRTASVARSFEALNQYLDFEMTKAQIASAFALMIKRRKARSGMAMPTTGDTADDLDASGNDLSQIVGGMMYTGSPDDSIEAVGPSITSTAFAEFVKVVLRQVASGLNVSYEILSRDFTGHNFSSLRQSLLEDRRHWRCRQKFIEGRLCDPIWMWFAAAGNLAGVAPFSGLTDTQLRQVGWTIAGWEWVDPQKDIDADITAIRAGLKSARKVAAVHGTDISANLRELAQLQDEAKDVGVELPDLFKVSNAQAPAQEAAEAPTGASEDVEAEPEAAAVG